MIRQIITKSGRPQTQMARAFSTFQAIPNTQVDQAAPISADTTRKTIQSYNNTNSLLGFYEKEKANMSLGEYALTLSKLTHILTLIKSPTSVE